ncbi:MAG: hypothetical protein WD844_17680 [Thermoleophilaceae bacterium]
MDLGRLRGTDYVVGVLAAALLGSLFLDWYETPTGSTLSAFDAYGATDIVLALFAVMALALVGLTATQRTSAVPVAWGALSAGVSLVVLPFVVVAALSVPEDGYTRGVGPVLGLALTLALIGAVWSTLRSERPGPAFARTSRAEVEKLPAPRP